jgi:hypothetical protein
VGGSDSALNAEEKTMYLTESDKKNKSDVLIARFNNYTEALQAQRILKDFGYSKDAVRVVELYSIARRMDVTKEITQQTINRVMISGTILISIVFITLACLFLRSIFSPPEIGMTILVWITLLAGGVIICTFIGFIVWRLTNSRAVDWGLEAVRRGKILISVRLRTPDDAEEIEREWREIGGEFV